MMGWIGRFFDPQFLLVLFAAVAGFATVLAVALPFLRRNERAARLKAIARRREELSKQQRDRMIKERQARRGKKRVARLQQVLDKAKLRDLAASKVLRQQLAAAGYRQPGAPVVFLFVRAGVLIGLLTAAILLIALSPKDIPVFKSVLYIAGAIAAGGYLPLLLLKNAAQKRQQQMTLAFPDALDLLVICTEAGLSIEAAFQRVTEEISEVSPVLSEEFGLTSVELAFLGDRRKAYTNLADRTGLPAARALATTLIQSEKYGTPVSQALRVLANDNRRERMARAEKKAGALPAQLTVPMIIFFLPALFLAIIGPAIIQVLDI